MKPSLSITSFILLFIVLLLLVNVQCDSNFNEVLHVDNTMEGNVNQFVLPLSEYASIQLFIGASSKSFDFSISNHTTSEFESASAPRETSILYLDIKLVDQPENLTFNSEIKFKYDGELVVQPDTVVFAYYHEEIWKYFETHTAYEPSVSTISQKFTSQYFTQSELKLAIMGGIKVVSSDNPEPEPTTPIDEDPDASGIENSNVVVEPRDTSDSSISSYANVLLLVALGTLLFIFYSDCYISLL
jgi:hypothetical protein